MTLETFFEKFELFADAPGAVGRMRELVLNFAVQGKLVGQDSAEEDAAITLARVLRDRDRQAKSLRIKEPSHVIADDEHTPTLPSGWCYASPDQLTAFHKNSLTIGPFGSSLLKSDYADEGVPLVFVRDIRSENFGGAETRFVSKEKAEELASHTVRPGDLLITKMGDPPGDTAIYPTGRPPAIITADCIKLTPHTNLVAAEYLRFAIRASQIAEQFAGITLGVAQQKVSLGRFRCIAVPLPPLAEQKRIVAKVDELMALCDRLEAQQQEREERAAALARASLTRFAEAPTPANLHYLFHPSYAISPGELRKSILTLAVQGKLVPQDPGDEPAAELIARISKMRHAKKEKPYEPVSLEETPYDVPFSWVWVRLGNISLASDSGWSPQCTPEARSGTNWGVLKVSAVSWGVFKPDENKALPPGMEGRPECEVKAGDFLLSRANTEELVARSVVVDQTPPRLMMSDKIVRFRFPDEIERAFINLANTSAPSRAYYANNASGTSSSMKNIGREVMCNLPLPIPPLAEQRRIVAKVDQLMALVDELEVQLAASRTTAAKLLDALVAEMTSR